MRNSWVRAWISAVGLLILASVIVRTRTSTLLKVEEPVMDWLLDGTDTSIWDRAAIFSRPWLLIVGTIALAGVGFALERRVGIVVVLTTFLAWVFTAIARGIAGRLPPQDTGGSSFPSGEVVHTGVFWGMVVMMLWWLGVPKLAWQIVLELAIVMTLVVSIKQVVSGDIWPSDAVGSAIVIALSLITAAAVFESNPATLPARRVSESVATA